VKLSGRFRSQARSPRSRRSQQGYLLLVILLLLALLMIALVAVAPRIAQQIKRDREEETIHRGTQYAKAIRLFYRKFGRYPTSLKELQSTNNLHFLRKQYKDPLSPNGEWRIIHLGEAKVTPTGFGSQVGAGGTPGQPGSAPGGAGGAFGQPSMGLGGMAGPGQPGAPGTSGGLGQPGTPPTGDTGNSGSSSSGSSSSGSTGSTFGGGAIVGVAPLNNGTSIKELNGKSHYNEWEFVYDPRFDPSNRQVVPGGIIPGGAPGTQQTGPGTQPTQQPGPTGPPMGPR
jgi:type II secretory pathway pseudopilin PulG